MNDHPPVRQQQRRIWFATAAVAALVVALVFTFIGDGVTASSTGLAGAVLDHAHALVWYLLAAALAVAAATGTWSRPSGALAITAGVVYLVFIVTLLAPAAVEVEPAFRAWR